MNFVLQKKMPISFYNFIFYLFLTINDTIGL